jgi:hypothetical protein
MPPTKKTAKKKFPSKLTPAALIPEQLAPLVIRLRHQNVILDSDIAELYGVETKRLNEAVKRNLERFPADLMFQINDDELENLKSQFVISSSTGSNLQCQIGTSSLRSQVATSKNRRGRTYLHLRLHRTRRRHAFKRPPLTPRCGGKHRHHVYLRPAPLSHAVKQTSS